MERSGSHTKSSNNNSVTRKLPGGVSFTYPIAGMHSRNMNKIILKSSILTAAAGLLAGCAGIEKVQSFQPSKALDYCVQQAEKTADAFKGLETFPRSIAAGKKEWRTADYRDWTAGFFPGIEWYLYEYTKSEIWRARADADSRKLLPLLDSSVIDHDIGFVMYNSFGNGYRLTNDTTYKTALLRSADSLATLFNPKTGTILSWPREVPGVDYPLRHNTIIDNMINLELLFWASKNGGRKELYDIAVQHATITMKNHFRHDFTSYHVVVYDTATGQKVKGITHQGLNDSSMWARGQSWAMYGYTMAYRETGRPEFLHFARKVTDVYLSRLPKDLIPYWDFDAPAMTNPPRDASAAAVAASSLLELSTMVLDSNESKIYREKAENMLAVLSSSKYQSGKENNAFLLHSTGHHPAGSEIDASIIYGDYYYIEALIRAKKLSEEKTLYAPL